MAPGLGFVLPVGVDLPRVPLEPRNIALSDWLPEHSLRVTDFLEHATEPAEPMAFLQASLFLREFFELAPFWHDRNYHDEELLLEPTPPDVPIPPGFSPPDHWEPTVDMLGSGATAVLRTKCFKSVMEYADRWKLNLAPDGWEPWSVFSNQKLIIGSGIRPPHRALQVLAGNANPKRTCHSRKSYQRIIRPPMPVVGGQRTAILPTESSDSSVEKCIISSEDPRGVKDYALYEVLRRVKILGGQKYRCHPGRNKGEVYEGSSSPTERDLDLRKTY